MASWRGYLDESQKFLEVAQTLDLREYPCQVVSNAALAAVAANDALGVRRTGQAAGDHSHADILSLLGQASRIQSLK